MHRLAPLGVCVLVVATATGSAQQQSAVKVGAPDGPVESSQSRAVRLVLPGTPESAFSTVRGHALNATNAALSGSVVRLRDARVGRIVGRRVTDEVGAFSFDPVDPGMYVVELMDADRDRVLAASEVVSLNASDMASVTVKLPFRPALLGGLMSSSGSYAAIISAASASGVLATASTTDVSP